MSTTVISNKQFWLCTFGLILFWIVVLTTAAVPPPSYTDTAISSSTKDNFFKHQHINERNCKALCQHCGCMGFYCGEECICECNDDKADTECISTMQSNARKLDIPFQLLIQGSSSNGFVRNALQFSYDGKIASIPHRNRRSTVVIYKPAIQNSLVVPETKAEPNKNTDILRHKRAVEKHFDWFNDFANTLVRPAPLGGVKKPKQTTEINTSAKKRAASKVEMDRSWFSDNTNLLLRPAPLFKRQHSNSEIDTDIKNNDLGDMSMSTVEKLPKVLTDTLRSIQETTIGGDGTGDIGETLRSHLKDSANVLQSQLNDNNLEFLPTGGLLRDNIQQTLSNLHSQIFPTNADNEREEEPPKKVVRSRSQKSAATPKKVASRSQLAAAPKLTWFRPMRFLHRVQQAIN